MQIPSSRDFAVEGFDPACYAELSAEWSLAVADIVDSTRLVAAGRYRDVNFIAAAVVAAAAAAVRRTPDEAVAYQFGGDGAVIAVPPERRDAAAETLAALGHWAGAELGVTLRIGLVPVADLLAAGCDLRAAIYDLGGGNGFGLFLGTGVPVAEAWVKADGRYRLVPRAGPLAGLEGLSCRWQLMDARRGVVMCIIADPTTPGPAGAAAIAELQAAVERIVPTVAAGPLGDGRAMILRWPVTGTRLSLEMRTEPRGRRLWRALRAQAETGALWLLDRMRLRLGPFDPRRYRHEMAACCDFRKIAGGLRLVLDLTAAEADAIEALLARVARQGLIHYGVARSANTTVTCLVGDVMAGRHIHFVDGAGLGFWMAANDLKRRRAAGAATVRPPAPASA